MDEKEKAKTPDLEQRLGALGEQIAGLRLEVPGLDDVIAGSAPEPERPASVFAGLLKLPRQPAQEDAEALASSTLTPRKDWVFGPQPRRLPKGLFPAGSGQRALLGVLWIAVTIAAAVLWLRSGFWPLSIHQALALPMNQAAGLARHQGSLYVAEKKKRLLFQLTPDGAKLQSVRRFPNASVGGLASGEDGLWSVEEGTGRVLRHALDQDCTVLKAYAGAGPDPGAVAADGSALWVSDRRTRSLQRLEAGETLKAERRVPLPDLIPGGLQVEAGKLWALDPETQTVLAYDLGSEGKMRSARAYPLGRWLPAGSKPSGLLLDSRSFWVVTDSPAQLHRFDRRALSLLRRLGLLR